MHCQLGRKTTSGDLYLWPWHSNSSEWGSKHIFPVNLAQTRSVVPKIFEAQTKKSQTALKTEPYLACGNKNWDEKSILDRRWRWSHAIIVASMKHTGWRMQQLFNTWGLIQRRTKHDLMVSKVILEQSCLKDQHLKWSVNFLLSITELRCYIPLDRKQVIS